MKYTSLILSLFLGCSFSSAHAVLCTNSTGSVAELTYDLSSSFTSTNNTAGSIIQIAKNFSAQVYAICPAHTGNTGSTTKRSYITTLPTVETIDGFKFLKLNEYLLGAMSINDSAVGTFYPPINYMQMGRHANVIRQQPFPVLDSNFTLKLKVIKPFVDFVNIPKQTLFSVYVTTGNDPLVTPVYTVSFSGSITVPQSCKIDNNNLIEINFGKISANDFLKAGVGNKPVGVNVQTRSLAIQCTNMASQAALTIRLEAEKTSNDMMISSNSAIGFKIADSSGNVLIPNNMSSTIPFKLENPSIVNIQAWPVSTNGTLPALGPFNANGYLRVDYE